MHILFAMRGSGAFVMKKISSNGNVTSEIYDKYSSDRTRDNYEILSILKFVIDADILIKLQLHPQLEHIMRLINVHMLIHHKQELLISVIRDVIMGIRSRFTSGPRVTIKFGAKVGTPIPVTAPIPVCILGTSI